MFVLVLKLGNERMMMRGRKSVLGEDHPDTMTNTANLTISHKFGTYYCHKTMNSMMANEQFEAHQTQFVLEELTNIAGS